MTIKLIPVEDRTVVRRLVEFAFWNMQFARKECIATSVNQTGVGNSVFPTAGNPRRFVKNGLARNDDSCAFSRIVIVCFGST